ncbi:MAG: thioredoxin domain-containing protein [Haloarculaceae archaeon]
MRRRQFLAGTATSATALLAGCGGNSGGDGNGQGTDTSPDGTTGPGGFDLPDHAALEGIDSQPYLGPPPGEADGLVVAFEDPSCPTCASFHAGVLPKIRSNLTEPGRATFVLRGYPVIYPWGEPATHALEAVYGADDAALWDLWTHYFDKQDDYRGSETSGVYDMTESHLAEATDLDATAVVDRARNGAVDAAVTRDLEAGEAAGAGRTTPHLFLYGNGEFLTKAQGSVSFSVIESALGV